MAAPADVRGSLHRRFTTTTVPTMNGISGLSPIGQQRLQAAGETQPTVSTTSQSHRVGGLAMRRELGMRARF
jgi:hypothetical protein